MRPVPASSKEGAGELLPCWDRGKPRQRASPGKLPLKPQRYRGIQPALRPRATKARGIENASLPRFHFVEEFRGIQPALRP